MTRGRQNYCKTIMAVLVVALAMHVGVEPVVARTLLKNVCRVKGQEENTLRGLGLVVGLAGTGDSDDSLPTMRALARAMELMNMPVVGPDLNDKEVLAKFKGTRNVALVWVTATVPASGGRRGDVLDCTVSAIRAKSLEHGELVFAALQGPDVRDPRIYALASGRLQFDNVDVKTHAKVHSGCRMEEDVFNAFQQDGKITLVLDKNHADFQISYEIAQQINTQLAYQGNGDVEEDAIATPIDSMNIVVRIPKIYHDVPVEFVAQVMELPIFELQTEARVVINERAGSIVIGGDVEVGPVVVTHKNITVDTEGDGQAKFVGIESGDSNEAKLKALVAALERVKVPPADIIEIIKGIERNGKLHAKLIIK